MKHTIALLLLKLMVLAEYSLLGAAMYFACIYSGLDPDFSLLIGVACPAILLFSDPREEKGKKIIMFPIFHYLRKRQQQRRDR